MIRLISWNVNRRTTKLEGQVKALEEYKPDIVALQEVTINTVDRLRAELERIGLKHIDDTTRLLENRHFSYYCVLTASRWPVIPLAELAITARHRILSVRLQTGWGPLELHNAYIPLGAKTVEGKSLRMETLQALYERLAHKVTYPRILCGDFNTPRQELPDGRVVTFAQNYKLGQIILQRTVRKIPGSVWDEAERNILCGLAEYDLADVYRKQHGYSNVEEYSWYHYTNGHQKGYRLDHIFASASLDPVECRYLHVFRENKLSDHSPIEAVFSPQLSNNEILKSNIAG